MKLKKGDLVLTNEGNHYYNTGVVSDITDEEVYIFLFDINGELSKYTTRHCLHGESIRKTAPSNIIEILVNCSTELIVENMSKLRSKE